MTASRLISLLATALVVGIVGQTLFFKFTAAPESVALFTQLGLEPFGRVGIGVAELVALILLVIPRTAIYGASLAAGLMGGALFSHLTTLGFAGDMGVLAALAVVALLASLTVLWIRRSEIPVIGPRLVPAS